MANEPYQPLNINTGSSQAAITAAPNVTPALDGLMEGIRSGFLSADDIRRRVADGPLEAATRKENLANITQIQPLQRQAAVAELQNVQAKQKFEAESLPILNATKRANLEQAHNNALEFGVPEEILKVFYASVPNFIPFDPEKLHDKKTGQVNIPYANEMIIKARQAAAKMAANKQFIGPVKQSTTDATGKMTETTTVMDQISGEAVGAPITTDTKAAQAGTSTKEIKSSRLSADGKTEEETVQRYDTNTGQLIGEASVIGSKPVKLTQEQANALQFSDRMGFNNALVADLSTKGFDPSSFTSTVQSWLPNRIRTEAMQSYTAATENWITAALRKESGAAISPTEYTQARKEYLPRDGDTPAVVAQKEALRLLVEEDIRLSTPGAGFWNPGGRNKNSAAARAASGNPTGMGSPENLADMSVEQLGNVSIEGRAPGAAAGQANIPVVQSPAEADALPAHIQFFRTPTGQTKMNRNYRP